MQNAYHPPLLVEIGGKLGFLMAQPGEARRTSNTQKGMYRISGHTSPLLEELRQLLGPGLQIAQSRSHFRPKAGEL